MLLCDCRSQRATTTHLRLFRNRRQLWIAGDVATHASLLSAIGFRPVTGQRSAWELFPRTQERLPAALRALDTASVVVDCDHPLAQLAREHGCEVIEPCATQHAAAAARLDEYRRLLRALCGHVADTVAEFERESRARARLQEWKDSDA